MSGSRRTFVAVASVVGLALVLAACASKTPGSTGPTGSPTSSGSTGGVTVKAASVGILGTALVNGDGRTLYMLTADQGGKVTCAASPCTGIWPPLLVPAGSSPVAGSGVNASMLRTVKTSSGATQVMYNNWPLYMYSGDSGSGQANGQGINSFGGVWHPLAPSGHPIVGGSSTTPSSSQSGYGY